MTFLESPPGFNPLPGLIETDLSFDLSTCTSFRISLGFFHIKQLLTVRTRHIITVTYFYIKLICHNVLTFITKFAITSALLKSYRNIGTNLLKSIKQRTFSKDIFAQT